MEKILDYITCFVVLKFIPQLLFATACITSFLDDAMTWKFILGLVCVVVCAIEFAYLLIVNENLKRRLRKENENE